MLAPSPQMRKSSQRIRSLVERLLRTAPAADVQLPIVYADEETVCRTAFAYEGDEPNKPKLTRTIGLALSFSDQEMLDSLRHHGYDRLPTGAELFAALSREQTEGNLEEPGQLLSPMRRQGMLGSLSPVNVYFPLAVRWYREKDDIVILRDTPSSGVRPLAVLFANDVPRYAIPRVIAPPDSSEPAALIDPNTTSLRSIASRHPKFVRSVLDLSFGELSGRVQDATVTLPTRQREPIRVCYSPQTNLLTGVYGISAYVGVKQGKQ